jgi:hypothetical protein
MATLLVSAEVFSESLSRGVRVEADRDLVCFSGGRFQGCHRWSDYAAFIEPTLAGWERELVYGLWVRVLGARHFVPSSADWMAAGCAEKG